MMSDRTRIQRNAEYHERAHRAEEAIAKTAHADDMAQHWRKAKMHEEQAKLWRKKLSQIDKAELKKKELVK